MDIERAGAAVLDPRRLRYVLALSELQSFRRAGAALAVPPHVLAREVKATERALGARLFERRGRNATPTAAGAEIAHIARRAMTARLAEIRESAVAEVELRIGCLDYGRGQAVQRAAIAEFQAHHPHVAVRLSAMPFRQQPWAVADGALAVAMFTGEMPALPGVSAEVLLADSVACALLPAGHPLAYVGELSMSSLTGLPLQIMAIEEAPEIVANMHDAIAESGWHGRHLPGVSRPSEVLSMVACGAGWAPTASSLLGWAPAGIVVRPLADKPLADCDVHIAWRDTDPLASAFVRLALELRDVIDAAEAQPTSSRGDRGDAPYGYSALLAQRYAERARIAGELHDTLLQDVLGSQLELEALRGRLPATLASERATLARVVERLGRAGRDGREVVRGLRTVRSSPRDLALALSGAAEELRESQPLEFRMRTDGTPRVLRPAVEAAAYRIGVEALTNAFRHAAATLVSVSLDYWTDLFRLRVSDDGAGVDPEVLRAGERPGHFGLALMRERAAAAGGTLSVRSDVGAGTTIELVVPGQAAFATRRR